MNCMKCGVEIPENQVFCDHCLAVMEEYPIKPDAHIHLPKREAPTEAPKRPVKKKRTPTLEEQVSSLRTKVLRLRLAAVVLVFLLCLATAFLGLKIYEDFTVPETGRNYTIDTSMKN